MGVLDGWRLCPRCGAALEPRDRGHLACPVCGSQYWANSAPAVEALVVRDGKVLLGRRAIEPRQGYWDLPGGFLEEGEAGLDGLRRELREETGLELESAELLDTHVEPYDGSFVFGVTWLVRAAEGEPRADDDVAELRWFGPDDFPAEMAFSHQLELIRAWAARDPKDGLFGS